jgi:hypothetical protein
VAPVFAVIEDFAFGGKIEIVCSRQKHFNHLSFVIVGELVKSADRLTGMFFSFSRDAANTLDMSFGNLIDRDEPLIIHEDITFVDGIVL